MGLSRRLPAASGRWPFWCISWGHSHDVHWSGRAFQAIGRPWTGSSPRADDRGSAQCGRRTRFSRGLWPNRGTTHQSSTLDAAHAIGAAADHSRPSPKRSITRSGTSRSRTRQRVGSSCRVEAKAARDEGKRTRAESAIKSGASSPPITGGIPGACTGQTRVYSEGECWELPRYAVVSDGGPTATECVNQKYNKDIVSNKIFD
jgi:hypothetical protein